MQPPYRTFASAVLLSLLVVTANSAEEFVAHRIGNVRSEACGVGDFNGDGQLDIVAGSTIYLAPDWKPHVFRTLQGEVDEQGKGYTWDFMNAPLDVDGDGRLDVVTCSWHGKRCEWLRNPGNFERPWRVALVEQNGHYEHGDLWDIDGDGHAREILPGIAGTVWYEVGKSSGGSRGLVRHLVSDKTMDWGVGAGDVNGDGRVDVLRPNAWFEAPADPRSGAWKEHPLAVGAADGKAGHTPQILVYDCNGDGLNDIVTSSAHGAGIYWYQRLPGEGEPAWKQHVIDDTWTQAHALTLADVDGDGDADLVTGKRFMAHNGHDPDALGPPGVYWYELRGGRTTQWIKHVVSLGDGIGAGMNIPVVDLDADGDLDIVVTGKYGGPVWFEHRK